MKKKLLVVSIVMFVGLALFITAQPGFRDRDFERGQRRGGVFADHDFLPLHLLMQSKDKIGLTADQEKKIGAMIEAHEQWAIKFQAEMKLKALKLRTAMTAEKTDFAKAESLIREQAGMHADMQIARLHLQKDIRSLLTPEQLAKLAELKKDFRAGARDGMRRRFEQRRDRRE